MPVSPYKVAQYLKAKSNKKQAVLDEKMVIASNDFQRICSHLIANYPVTHIYQWGS